MSLSEEEFTVLDGLLSTGQITSPMNLLGVATAFLREYGRTPIERELADKIDALADAEVKAEIKRLGG